MDTNQLYKITKLSHLDSALAIAAKDAESYWKNMHDSNESPNVDYWVVGYLNEGLPEIGNSLIVDRIIRNGVSMPGVFYTSPCSAIYDVSSDLNNPIIMLYTQNSCYSIEKYES